MPKIDFKEVYAEALESGQFDSLIQATESLLRSDKKFINKVINADNDKILNLFCKIPLDQYAENEVEKILAFIDKLLDEHDARISSTNKLGDTPLHNAIRVGNTKIVDLLLQYEESTDVLDNENKLGFTPLALAVHYKKNEIEKILLSEMKGEVNKSVIPEGMSMKEFQRLQKQQLKDRGGIEQLRDGKSLHQAVEIIESIIYTDDVNVAINLIGKLDDIYQIPTMQPLLDMMAFSALGLHYNQAVFHVVSQSGVKEKYFKIFLPGELSSLKFMIKDEETLGMYTMKNSVFISTLDDPSERITRDPNEIMSLILHESTHFVCQQLFNNSTLPYLLDDANEIVAYRNMFKQTMDRLSNFNSKEITDNELYLVVSIIANVKRYPNENSRFAELIVRVSEVIGLLGERGHAILKQHFPELLEHYETRFNTAILKYLKENEQKLITEKELAPETPIKAQKPSAKSIFSTPINKDKISETSETTLFFSKKNKLL